MNKIKLLSQIEPEAKNNEKAELDPQDFTHEYLQLIDDLPDIYTEYDLKGKLICYNEAVVKMASRNNNELAQLTFYDLMDKETVKRVRRAYNEVYRTGIPKKGFVNEIIQKNGNRVVLEGCITLKKVNGQVVGFRGIWQDITERRKTEQALVDHQHHLEAIFSSVKDGIIAVDAQGLVSKANQAVENICGVPVADIMGKPFFEAPGQCGRSCHHIIRDALSNRSEIKEYQIACRRGGRRQQVIVLNSSPLIDGNGQPTGAVFVIKDITEQLGLEKELKGRYQFQNIIGKSPKMQEIYDLLESLASLGVTVLITGESGTGKELVAKALHYAGERSDKPFIKVNCSALPESLLESELFGHVKGSFTGAFKDRQGRFQAADGGTILLDEIGDVSPLIQLKLLRVLQEKEFERVGESTSRKVDVRVIAATNKDLKEKVRSGEFREDLYYRLKVMEIAIPALRARLEDLPLLVDHFCNKFRKSFKKKIEGVSGEVLDRFMNYGWPGNVRELEHALERAFVLCNERTIRLGQLPMEVMECAEADGILPQHDTRSKRTDAHSVLTALEKTGWNKTKAADLLGCDRRTIHRKVKEYHLEKKEDLEER